MKISWPIIVAQLGMVFTGFFDNIMVSQLGYQELAAAGICNSIFFLVVVFPMGITMAYATVASIVQGKNKVHVGGLLFRDTFKVTLVVTIFTVALLALCIYNFDFFRQKPEIKELSISYLWLLCYSCIPMIFFFFVKNIADGYGFTRAGMVVTSVSLALNVFLNWVFIYGNLGAHASGLDGAGYATIISRAFSFVAIVFIFFWHDDIPIRWIDVRNSLHRRNFSFTRQIMRLGIPTGLQYFFEVAAFALAAILAGWLGSKELAAHQMAITIASLTYMFASGIASGTSINVAKAYGQKNKIDIKAYGKASLQLTSIAMFVFGLVFAIFSKEIAQQFVEDPEVVRMGAQLLLFAAIFQLSDGIQAVSVGLLRGIEDVKFPSFITLIAYWIFAIPLGYLFGFYYEMSITGIWIGLTGGLTISAVLLSLRFNYLTKLKL